LSLGTASQAGTGEVTLTPWTVDLPPGAPLLKAVPSGANVYMVLRIQWQDLYRRAMAVCDAALTDPTDKPVERILSDLAASQGVDLQKDLLSRLEPLVLVHDFPQHPLQLPLMMTVVAAAEPGSQAKATAAIAKLTAAASDTLDKKATTPKPEPEEASTQPARRPGDFTRLRIRTDKDGISYLQFGLVGPGWGWYENRLVISWSPAAVRANAVPAGRVPSSAFALPPATRAR
jgi:hypothetical protein